MSAFLISSVTGMMVDMLCAAYHAARWLSVSVHSSSWGVSTAYITALLVLLHAMHMAYACSIDYVSFTQVLSLRVT
jgi:hypothetical protein